jgi:ankyrin repeat protein
MLWYCRIAGFADVQLLQQLLLLLQLWLLLLLLMLLLSSGLPGIPGALMPTERKARNRKFENWPNGTVAHPILFAASMARKKAQRKQETTLVPHRTLALSVLLEKAKTGNAAQAVQPYLDAGGSALALIDAQGAAAVVKVPLLHTVALTNRHPHKELAESVRLLIAAGADINALYTDTERDGVNLPPLMCAAGRVCCAKVQTVLLDAGADPYVRPAPRYLTALHKAAQAGSSENCKLLVARAAPLLEEKDYLDRTALRYATANGLVHTAQALLQCGADINAGDNIGRTALFSACSNGLVDVAIFLLQAGADVHVVDSAGDTTLVAAVQSGYPTLVRLLLTLGADVSAASTATERALCMAASKGSVPMLQLLVERGLSVTAAAADALGNTLLMHAVSGGHTAAAEWLLQQGVAVNADNRDGDTALHFASDRSECADAAMIALLLANSSWHSCSARQCTVC